MTLPSYVADRRLLPRRSGRRPADVDTSSRTQITRFGTAPENRPGDQVAAPNGGSACGYQPDFALSALQETADVRVADPYISAPARGSAAAGQPSNRHTSIPPRQSARTGERIQFNAAGQGGVRPSPAVARCRDRRPAPAAAWAVAQRAHLPHTARQPSHDPSLPW
jgi:hypothetical protein